jgi:hypothetical protein
MALVLKGVVADFAESVKEYGAAKRILLLAFIESDVTTKAQFLVLQPLERLITQEIGKNIPSCSALSLVGPRFSLP